MSVSNKTLSILLLAAIVVSLGGTFISLNRLGTLPMTGYQAFGENATGTINLSVQERVEITLENRSIDFGDCQLKPGALGLLVNTEGDEDTEDYCSGFNDSTVHPITVQNTGNVNVMVMIEVNDTDNQNGGGFLDISTTSANSRFEYKTENHTVDAGCIGDLSAGLDYLSFTAIDNPIHTGCSDLQPNNGADKFITQFQLGVPDNAQGASSVLVTFVATKV